MNSLSTSLTIFLAVLQGQLIVLHAVLLHPEAVQQEGRERPSICTHTDSAGKQEESERDESSPCEQCKYCLQLQHMISLCVAPASLSAEVIWVDCAIDLSAHNGRDSHVRFGRAPPSP